MKRVLVKDFMTIGGAAFFDPVALMLRSQEEQACEEEFLTNNFPVKQGEVVSGEGSHIVDPSAFKGVEDGLPF